MRTPFTASQARERGLSRRQLAKQQRVFHGVYLPQGPEPTFPELVAAAQLALPAGSCPTSTTRLRLAGARLGPAFPLWFVTPRRVRVRGIRCIVDATPGPVSRAVAFGHLAARSELVDAVAMGDHLLRRGLLSEADIWQAVPPGNPVPFLVRDGADSPQETRLRLMVGLAGLPTPSCQVPVVSAGIREHVDLGYEEYRVALEYEGRHHVGRESQWSYDIDRYERMTTVAGWTVLRFTLDHLHRPYETVERVHRALAASGYRGGRPTYSPQWRISFG